MSRRSRDEAAAALAGAIPMISAGEGTIQELTGSLKMFSRTLEVVTDSRVEIYNVTGGQRIAT